MNTKEQILAEGCGRGDNAARRELYDRYAGLLLGVCLRYTGERASAEDALHDAFLKIFGAIARFRYRGEGSLRAWMERIAVNTALERLRRIRGKESDELAVVFESLAQVAEYCRVDNATFRTLKRNLPGPFTFVLEASSRVPDKALARRKTIGVRIPAHPVARAIVEALGVPMVTASVRDDDEVVEYTTDPELIHERYGREVELVIDGGPGDIVPTTVVDLTDGEPEVLREGKGELR